MIHTNTYSSAQSCSDITLCRGQELLSQTSTPAAQSHLRSPAHQNGPYEVRTHGMERNFV